MAIDNQLVIGTIIFAGLAYFVFAQKDQDPKTEERHVKKKEGSAIWEEYEELVNRMREFKSNDSKKGKFKKLAPLSESDRNGLVEVITRLNQLDKRQAKTQALPRGEAKRLHSAISDVANEAQGFLDRYEKSCQTQESDIRTVAKGLARRESAITRGRISHSRMADDFVTDRSPSGGVKKRKINFVSNRKPQDVFATPPSDNTLTRDRSRTSRSAFETNLARDDSHNHARQDAEMEESTSSGAHGKNGNHIKPVEPPKSSRSTGNEIRFDQANGPENDNEDRVQRTVSAEESPVETQIVDLTGRLSEDAEERMEQDLIDKQEQLARGDLKLTKALDKQLRTAVSVLYQDDPDEGDRNIQLLRKYAARDMNIGIIEHIPEQQPRGKKRPIDEAIIARGKEKLTITQVQTGERVKLSRGTGFVGQRDPAPPPIKYPQMVGRRSVSREQAYEEFERQQMLRNVQGGDI